MERGIWGRLVSAMRKLVGQREMQTKGGVQELVMKVGTSSM